MTSIQRDADALKKLPLVGGYIEDPTALLVRPKQRAQPPRLRRGRAVRAGPGRPDRAGQGEPRRRRPLARGAQAQGLRRRRRHLRRPQDERPARPRPPSRGSRARRSSPTSRATTRSTSSAGSARARSRRWAWASSRRRPPETRPAAAGPGRGDRLRPAELDPEPGHGGTARPLGDPVPLLPAPAAGRRPAAGAFARHLDAPSSAAAQPRCRAAAGRPSSRSCTPSTGSSPAPACRGSPRPGRRCSPPAPAGPTCCSSMPCAPGRPACSRATRNARKRRSPTSGASCWPASAKGRCRSWPATTASGRWCPG